MPHPRPSHHRHHRHHGSSVLLPVGVLLAVIALLAGALAPARAAERPEPRRAEGLQVRGNGFGHGHGLSQWGAYFRAKAGQSDQQILRFYYPTLRQGRAGGSVSVLISADTSADVAVRDRDGLVVRALSNDRRYRLGQPRALQWRLVAADGGRRTAIEWKARGAGWRTLRTVPGEAEFDAGGAPITLRTPAGDRAYRGVLRSAAPRVGAARDTVNVLPLEQYLRGVVPREVPALWPGAAVRAQSVAARTYAAFERRQPLAPHYEICDTALCQVYGGATDEHPASDRAVQATARRVLLAGGRPAFAQFSASNGGWQSAGSVDYLVSQEDPFDTAYRGWSVTIPGGDLARAYPGLGAFVGAEVTERDGDGAFGGRVVTLRLTFVDGAVTVDGDDFRSIFGLRSTLFRVL
ncbi:SpoIID/LytB domain-containing protein [Nocardioides sp.]|uniref:SpoIID/LytB domain-containing protein n=1 Tax=Nocardioides sp. TaxID=35761 RepID=UPI00351841DF